MTALLLNLLGLGFLLGLACPLYAQNALPEGDAKEGVQAMCVQCHQIGRVTSMHLSREEWKNTVEDMVRMGAQVPPDWVDPIADYLALNFPEKVSSASSPGARFEITMKIAQAGESEIEANERAVLSHAELFPRDVATGNDTIIWYANAPGRLERVDMATGKRGEWPLPSGRQSRVCGMATLKESVWYVACGTSENSLVRFDPNTEQFQTWTLPSATGAPSRLVVLSDGRLALTIEGSDQIVLAVVVR